MIINNKDVQLIENSIKNRGIELRSLRESIVDHICCQIEHSDYHDFEDAFQEAMSTFDGEEMNAIQTDIKNFNAFKWFKFSNGLMYSFGFIAAFLISTGFLFKLMHWPWASMALVFGVFFLNFGFLPIYFYGRYKNAIQGY